MDEVVKYHTYKTLNSINKFCEGYPSWQIILCTTGSTLLIVWLKNFLFQDESKFIINTFFFCKISLKLFHFLFIILLKGLFLSHLARDILKNILFSNKYFDLNTCIWIFLRLNIYYFLGLKTRIKRAVFKIVRKIPKVRKQIEKELGKVKY